MNPELDRIRKGPSVNEVRSKSENGRVKVDQILTYRDKGISVEEARAAMLAADEAPRGNKQEARPAVPAADPDMQTRWDKARAKKTSGSPTIVKADYSAANRTPRPQEVQEVPSTTGYDVHFELSDGTTYDFQAPDKVTVIREVKKFQAKLQATNNRLPIGERLSAKVEYTPINPAPEENSAPTKISVEASTAVPVETNQSVRGEGGSSRSDAQPERIENSKFVLEIFQDDGEWVGRISYKNGAGTEEFRADTRKALDMKLLEGKAHATLKVREIQRRDQYHDDLDKVYDIPDYTQEEFNALKPGAQHLVIDAIAGAEALRFRESVPAFYGTAENTKKLQAFLHKRDLPITCKNLKYAFEELADDLEQRPQATQSVKETPAQSAPPVVVDSTPKAPATAPASAASVSAAPAPEVRKRGSFDFKPGFTSTGSSGLDEAEDGKKSTEPSEAELRTMPLEELKKIARKGYKNRSF